MIELVIPGKPIPKLRPRFCKNGYVYDSQKKESQQIRHVIMGQLMLKGILKPLEGCIFANMTFHMPIPISWPQKRRKEVLEKWDPTRPDIDNICKMVLDVMTGLVYVDDNQVVRLKCEKIYSDNPRVEVEITELKEIVK